MVKHGNKLWREAAESPSSESKCRLDKVLAWPALDADNPTLSKGLS